jgi:hypothetical protein
VAEDGRRRRQDDEPKPKGLRQMLASLPVIWPGARAEDFPALLLDAKAFDTAALKKHYLKAVRCARHSQFELQAHGALAIWKVQKRTYTAMGFSGWCTQTGCCRPT